MTAVRSKSWRSLAFITALMTVFAMAVPFVNQAKAATTDNTIGLEVVTETDSNPTGATHTLTATLRSQTTTGTLPPVTCPDATGCEIDFEIESGPAATVNCTNAGNPTDTCTGGTAEDGTNSPTSPDMTCTVASGATSCTVRFTSSTAGTNVVRAWVDDDKNNTTVDADTTEGRNAGAGDCVDGTDTASDCSGTATPGDRTERDDTDVVSKQWFGAPTAGLALDCDDESGNAQGTGVAATTDDNQINQVGQAETYTCRATTPDGADADTARDVASGIVIDGENLNGPNDPDNDGTGGATSTADFGCTTDATGTCTISVPGAENQAGTATICFWTDDDNDNTFNSAGTVNDGGDCAEVVGAAENDDTTDTVSKTWAQAGTGATINATPEDDSNTQGTSHTVSATVTDQFGNPVAGVLVDFDVEGRNDGVGGPSDGESEGNDVATNAQGVATFTYTDEGTTVDPIPAGTSESDTIYVCIDAGAGDQNCGTEGAPDEGPGTTDEVRKFWFNTAPAAADVVYDPGADGTDCENTDAATDSEAPSNVVGTTHDACASVFDSTGAPIPGAEVTFTKSGPGQFWTDADGDTVVDAGELSDTATVNTNATGDAVVNIYSEATGTTTVTATSGSQSDSGTKKWTAEAARNIACDPETASNPPGTTHIVTCTATDRFGNPTNDVDGDATYGGGTDTVTFSETGAGRLDTAAVVTLDANGQAEAVTSTTDNESGAQTINAEFTVDFPDSDAAADLDDACDQASGNLSTEEGDGSDTDTDAASPAPAGNCETSVEKTWEEQPTTQCSDGVDNDGDGWVDFPDDPGCESAADDDESNEPIVTNHARTAEITKFKHIDLPGKKKPALMVKGVVTVDDGFDACANQVPVKVQIRASGEWITRKTDSTSENGVFKVLVRHVHAKYRVVAPAVDLTDEHGDIDHCLKAKDTAKYDH